MFKNMFKSTATIVALIAMVGASLAPSLTAFADSVAKSNELIFKRDSSGNVVAIISKNGTVTPIGDVRVVRTGSAVTGIETIFGESISLAASYVLPAATSSVLGGVIADGSTITVTASGVITAVGGGTAQTYTAAHSSVAADLNTITPNTVTSASAVDWTVPLDASLTTVVGDKIFISQEGAGAVTFVAESGVTITSPLNAFTTDGQYSIAGIMKIAENAWRAFGNLIP